MERDAGRKTALLISSHASVVGGGQVSLLLLLRFLPRDRFTPVLLCPSEGEVASRARNLDVDVAVLSIGSPLDSVSALGRALLLRRQARRMRAAVVHCDTLYAALACGMGLWGLRVPLVFHARVAQSGGRWDAIVPRVCTRIICVSEAVA
ncbi:MAG TPA: glycosyltransferase, partial [Candidatus Sulfotelmatobacter sp.]|nr:glycosyltransferase [Candidatus Sulfotelmatobacter sp.]